MNGDIEVMLVQFEQQKTLLTQPWFMATVLATQMLTYAIASAAVRLFDRLRAE